jgi:putative Flp pilus-assembly TadE/G-like protein
LRLKENPVLTRRSTARSEQGQVLVIVAVGLVAMIAMVALVVDGGHAWGQQREAQNGADAASEAGAVRLAQNLPFIAAGKTQPYTDSAVAAAVADKAADNSIDVEQAIYTSFAGDPLPGPIVVGSLGNVPPPAAAAGVQVKAAKDFDTFLAGVIGFQTLTARAQATAVSGYLDTLPPNSTIPVTFPVTITACDGSGNLIPGTDPWVVGQYYAIPLCKGGPGNVGWIDWTPPSGGTSDLEDSVHTPDNPEMTVPDWFFVAETGNLNASKLEDELNVYHDKIVYIPLFDATCDTEPIGTGRGDCTGGPGNGQNQYYHFPSYAAFLLDKVDFDAGCSGQNSTGCFFGTFKDVIGSGTLRAGTGTQESPLGIVGVQLIK